MDYKDLGSRLKKLREERKISINKIATMISTSHDRVKKIEAGAGMNVETFLRYVYALGCDIKIVSVPVAKIPMIEQPISNGHEQPVIVPIEIIALSNGNGTSAKKRIVIEDKD